MPRDLVVANGRVAIALDGKMRIRDFFYPQVGLENHVAGHEFRNGIWVDGQFSWIGDDWQFSLKYLPETNVTKCKAVNQRLNLELTVNDAIYSFLDVYLRKIVIRNEAESKRKIRLFFSHDFHIYGEDTGDTVMYDPSSRSIVHYKRNRYFLINGVTDRGEGIFEYATGQKEAFGKEGTWRDAEDGVLEGNPIAQGSVDSTLSFEVDVYPKSANTIYYWIACGKNLEQVEELNTTVRNIGVEQMLLETENYWSAWVNRHGLNLSILPQKITRLFKTSLLIMRTHADKSGAIIASCDSDVLQFNRDTYSYVWPRDSSICAMAFDMAGFQEVSRKFFRFCNRIITEKGYFRHKYWSDGSVGSSWHALIDNRGEPELPIQLDETGLVLYALWQHYQKYHDLEFIASVYPNLVIKASDFMLKYKDEATQLLKPSFDMWEEKTGAFTSTILVVSAALDAAAKFAEVFYDSGRQKILNEGATQLKDSLLKHLYDYKLRRLKKAIYANGSSDSSVDSCLLFGLLFNQIDLNSELSQSTVNAVVDKLWLKEGIGGLARYENDEYHKVANNVPGNPWFICTLWLARWYIAAAKSINDLKKAMDLLSWAETHSLPSGILAEQLNPFDASPVSVSPLLWSHAEFVTAVCEYVEKYQRLRQVEPLMPHLESSET